MTIACHIHQAKTGKCSTYFFDRAEEKCSTSGLVSLPTDRPISHLPLRHGSQSPQEDTAQFVRVLQADTKPTQIRRTAKASRPFQLVIVRQQHKRRRQGEICAKRRTLCGLEVVKEDFGVCEGVERA